MDNDKPGAAATSTQAVTAAILRAEIGRRRARIYQLGALLAIHPSRLSEMLNERRPLPPELGRRAMETLETWEETRLHAYRRGECRCPDGERGHGV